MSAALREHRRGLLLSWGLVALPVIVGFLGFFLLERPPHRTVLAAIAEGLFWAVTTTLVVGTLGYATMLEIRTGGRDSLTWREKILLGGGLFVLGLVVSFIFRWTRIYDHPAVSGLVLLTVFTAGFVASRGASLVVTIGVATCTPLALFGYVGALRWMGVASPEAIPWGAPIFALVAGCILGIIAYFLGTSYDRYGPKAVA